MSQPLDLTAVVRLENLRQRLFVAIEQTLSVEGHCKRYEGAFAILFPNYFEAKEPGNEAWGVSLDCYVIGPHRHYSWYGRTLSEAVERAEREVASWIIQHDEWWASEGRTLAEEYA